MATQIIEQPELVQVPTDSTSPSTAILRVLHVVNGEHYSGAERVQDLLGSSLGRYGFDVDFASLKLGRFAALRQCRDAELFDVPMRSRFDARPVAALIQILRKHKYDLVHTHTARSALVGAVAAAICRVPHVHHLHSPTSLDSTRWLTNRLNVAIEKISLRHADAVIAVSHTLGEYARSHGLGNNILQVVPNGVPVQGPLPQRATPTGTWTLGAVALFRPRKGLEILLEALADLRRRGIPIRLRAVGAFETISYEVQIKSLADRLNLTTAIDWVGFTCDVPAELARMDLFVLPSLFGEGLPMVILEAMAAGVPVVATRVEGVPEAIRDSLDGLLAEPANAKALADRIADFVQGRLDWQQVRASAHQRQANRFSDHSMAAGVANVYRRVLLDRAHPRPTRRQETELAPPVQSNQELLPLQRSTMILGTRIDNLTLPEAIGAIKQKLSGREPVQVCFVNAECINVTYRNDAYRQVLAEADLVLADGIGLKIAGAVFGRKVRDNVNGTDLFPRLCMALAGSDHSLFLLGGRPGVADAVGRWLAMHFPNLKVRGTRDGFFAPHEEPAVLEQIAASGADLLLVALGVPRQDAWINKHLPETGCKVAMGVGGLFDFYSGRVPRAPLAMRKRGLEWLFRLYQEPRRLAKRYLLGNPLFLWRVACERAFGERPAVAYLPRAATRDRSPVDSQPARGGMLLQQPSQIAGG